MRKTLLLALLGAAACSTGSSPTAANGSSIEEGSRTGGGGSPETTPATTQVVTDKGPVIGAPEGGVLAFHAIPYAAPPVGNYRWTAPQPHQRWLKALDGAWPAANDMGALESRECMQTDSAGNAVGTEDCLTVDVWTPSVAGGGKLPVLFFLHGGGNVTGDTAETRNGHFLYDGAALAAATHSVVVSANYRLGVFGFLAHPLLADPAHDNSSGNYGLMDQQAALAWTQTNAAAFGGDKTKVMLFGQSAGALDVCAQVTSPLSAGLFSTALMESGGCAAQAKSDALANGTNAVSNVMKCTGSNAQILSCMRGLPAEQLQADFPEQVDLSGSGLQTFDVAVDGYVVTDVPMSLLQAGSYNHVPLVVGANADETSKSVMKLYPDKTGGMSDSEYLTEVVKFTGNLKEAQYIVDTMYPKADYGGNARTAYIAMSTDAKFVCPAREIAKNARSHQAAVWRYYYTHTFEGQTIDPTRMQESGAFHGAELILLWGNLNLAANYTPTAAEQALATTMQDYWASFAANKTPNYAGAKVQWPLYNSASDAVLKLDDTPVEQDGVRSSQCDFWVNPASYYNSGS